MAREVTAKDLGLDDDYDDEEETGTKDTQDPGPKYDGEDTGPIGAEVVAREVEDKKERQKKAEEDIAKEELDKVEGKKKASDEEDEPDTFRYKDQAAAEKAVKEAKRKISELGSKASKLEKIATDLQKKMEDANKASPTPQKPSENPFAIERQKITDDTIEAVADLKAPAPPDSDDPDYQTKLAKYKQDIGEYNKKVGRLWGEAQAKIAKSERLEALQAEKDAREAKDTILSAVEKALEEAELITSETSQKESEFILRLFWAEANTVPKNLTVEEQLKRTVAQVKEVVEGIRGKATAEERTRHKKDKEEKEKLDVLGRGSKVTKHKETEPSSTFGEALRAAKERRTLRYNP